MSVRVGANITSRFHGSVTHLPRKSVRSSSLLETSRLVDRPVLLLVREIGVFLYNEISGYGRVVGVSLDATDVIIIINT